MYRLPSDCPSCGTALTAEGAHTFCPNRSCPARVYGRAAFFVGRGQMDIENLGPETVKRLLDIGLVKDVPDLYFFDPDALLGAEGFGEKKVALIREGIQKSKSRPYAAVLASLGLDEIGPRVADLLIENGYDSIDPLLEAARKRDPDAFTGIEGIGPKIAEKIIVQLNDPAILGMIGRLRQAGLRFAREKKPGVSPAEPGLEGVPGEPSVGAGLPQTFKGEVWCVTGSFERFKPREKAMEEVVARGGIHSSSVTGKTTHLLAGAQPGGKLQKAKKLGLRIVSEEEFLARLMGPGP